MCYRLVKRVYMVFAVHRGLWLKIEVGSSVCEWIGGRCFCMRVWKKILSIGPRAVDLVLNRIPLNLSYELNRTYLCIVNWLHNLMFITLCSLLTIGLVSLEDLWCLGGAVPCVLFLIRVHTVHVYLLAVAVYVWVELGSRAGPFVVEPDGPVGYRTIRPSKSITDCAFGAKWWDVETVRDYAFRSKMYIVERTENYFIFTWLILCVFVDISWYDKTGLFIKRCDDQTLQIKHQTLNCNVPFYVELIVQTITFKMWDRTH